MQFHLPSKPLTPTASPVMAASPLSLPTLPPPGTSSSAQSPLTPESSTHMLTSCSPQFMSGQVMESLTPYVATCAEGRSFCILPLIPCVPGQNQARSSRDLVLPPAEAFSALSIHLPPAYPLFNTHNCTWNSVLSLIKQPLLLWPGYAPKNLGDYPDIKSLRQAWKEGMLIEGVGYTPPLRLIDERWGSCLG